jgi:phage baseplate assembly protein W
VGVLYGESINVDSPFFARLTDDQAILTQAILLRLSTKRGFYWADPEYGLSLADYINDGLTPDALARLPVEVQSELEKDERIASAAVSAAITETPQGAAVNLSIRVTPVEGKTFTFVLAASAVTVDLLTVGNP